MIKAKLNVTKIDKAKLYKGEKGTYLDIVLIEKTGDAYGNDYMVVQDVSKEERERGVKGAILGNGKTIGQRAPQQAPAQPAPKPRTPPAKGADEDVPF